MNRLGFPESKRVFDLFIAVVGLLFLSPIFMLIGFLIKLNDQGSVFFKQERIGKNDAPFTLYKFRSISVLKTAERIWKGTVSLPVYPKLTKSNLIHICQTIRKILVADKIHKSLEIDKLIH